MRRIARSKGRVFGTTPVDVTFCAGARGKGAPLAAVEAYPGQRLLEVAERYDLVIPMGCGGGGTCGTCVVWIEQGMDSLEPMGDEEQAVLTEKLRRRPSAGARLACRCTLQGPQPVTVRLSSQTVVQAA